MQRKCISAVLWQIPISMHEIFTEMYSTVSTGPSCMESSTRFSQASLKCRFPKFHYRTCSFCCLSHFFSIRTLQILSKRHTWFQYVLKHLLTYYFSASNRLPFLEIAPFFATLILPHPHSQSSKSTCSFNRWSPAPLKRVFLTFHFRTSCFCCLPIFSLLEPSKPHLKHTQDFNRSWKASSHIIFLL